MPGNDFEKQVQQKMDELQFAPSDAVWPEVEKQIAEHKKRRGLFLWLPLTLMMLGSAAWWYNTQPGKNSSKPGVAVNTAAGTATNNHQKTDTANISSITTVTSPNAHPPKKEPFPGKDNAADPQAPGKIISVPAHDRLQRSIVTMGKDGHQKNDEQQQDKVPGNSVAVKKPHAKESATKMNHLYGTHHDDKETVSLTRAGKKNTGKLNNEKSVADDGVIDGLSLPIAKAQQTNTEWPAAGMFNKQMTATPFADSATHDAAAMVKKGQPDSIQTIDTADRTKAIAKNTTPVKTKKNIEWGITMNAGRSSVSSGFATLFPGQNFASAPSSSLSNNANGGNNTGAGTPSAIKPGFSFTAGIFIRKPLGRNFKMLTGLHYHYYSNHIMVGTRIDPGTGQLQYQADTRIGTSAYTNQFHFIELPVIIEKQLGKTSRWSVNTGLVLSFLAGSNSLIYDAQKANYTTDKSYINKTQLGLLAGFHYQLFPASYPVEIGPQLNYDLGSIFKKELYGSRHLFFYGINARVLLHKNKR